MNIFQRIVKWNKERRLIENGFNHKKEVSFVIEELLESSGNYDSINAREKAEKITDEILKNSNTDTEKLLDAFGDVIVFAIGAIAKLGHDPEKVMDEIIKGNESRKGKLIDGKFVKDPNAKRYEPNFKNTEFEK